jgi:hemerythrin
MSDKDWDKYYKVGIKPIDAQHRVLIRMISELLTILNENFEKELISRTITSLSEYTVNHLEFEENLMEKYNYPEIDLHKKEHEELKLRILNYIKNYRENDNKLLIEITHYLIKWLKNHIMNGADKQLGEFLKSKGFVE